MLYRFVSDRIDLCVVKLEDKSVTGLERLYWQIKFNLLAVFIR